MIGSDSAPATDAAHDLLVAAAALSRRFGEDPEYARAGGGNSSVKDGSTLWIKPSGVSLASITAASLMPLALEPLLELARRSDVSGADAGSDPVMRVAMAARLRDEGPRRPSVECVFHALIPHRFVVHTHPTTVNMLTCARDGEAIARELFDDEVLWVPYVDPGLPLAREIDRRRRAWRAAREDRSPEVVLLQSHGLIVAGDDPGAIVERSEAVVARVRERGARGAFGVGEQTVGDPRVPAPESARVERLALAIGEALGTDGAPAFVVPDTSPDAVRFASTPEGRSLAEGGPLTPDQIVYAGSWPRWVDVDADADDAAVRRTVADALGAARRELQASPIVVVAGVGVFATGAGPRAAQTACQVYVDAVRVGLGTLAFGGARPLAPAERAFIETWEAEAYRRGLDAG